MSEMSGLTFDRLLERLAEKRASRLSHEPNRLYPQLLTIDQAMAYLGRAWEDAQPLTHSGRMPTVLIHGRIFLDRLDLDNWIVDNKTGWV
jgi:hypothetical protein